MWRAQHTDCWAYGYNLFSGYKSNSWTSQTNTESTTPPVKRYKANDSTPHCFQRCIKLFPGLPHPYMQMKTVLRLSVTRSEFDSLPSSTAYSELQQWAPRADTPVPIVVDKILK